MTNKRGSILITAYIVLICLMIFGGIFFTRTVSDRKLFDMSRERQEAFYIAESAVDVGLSSLRASSSYAGTSSPVAYGRGEYEVLVCSAVGSKKQIRACGYIPDKSNKRAQRSLEVITKSGQPDDFFGNAIWSAGDVTLNGNSFEVNGKVIYADDLNAAHPEHIDDGGNPDYPKNDPSISPLAQFDFEYFRDIAITQGNLYDSTRLSQIQTSNDTFPTTNSGSGQSQSRGCQTNPGADGCEFWYDYPTDINDPTTGTPNIVYVEGDMVLNGNIGTIGGFFLVVGDVLTDPNATQDTSINGNGQVNGSIYSTGDFRINGGAGGLNIDGGVWAGNEARLNGNSNVTWNEGFMAAIGNMFTEDTWSWTQLYTWNEWTATSDFCDACT